MIPKGGTPYPESLNRVVPGLLSAPRSSPALGPKPRMLLAVVAGDQLNFNMTERNADTRVSEGRESKGFDRLASARAHRSPCVYTSSVFLFLQGMTARLD